MSKNRQLLSILGAVCFVSAGVAACATGKTSSGSEDDVILLRSGQLKTTPEWVDEIDEFGVLDGNAISLGETTATANEDPKSAIPIALEISKKGFCDVIDERLEYIFQNLDDDETGNEDIDHEQISEEACSNSKKIKTSQKNYWEKIKRQYEVGHVEILHRVYVATLMPEDDFHQSVYRALSNAQGRGDISPEFVKEIKSEWQSVQAGPAGNWIPAGRGR